MFGRHRDVALASLVACRWGKSCADRRLAPGGLRGAGVPDRSAAWFADLIALVGAAQATEDQLAGAGEATSDMGKYMSMLPEAQFPNLRAVAAEMAGGDADDRFEFSVELLVPGIETYISR
jgi:hypothetical protein